MFARYGSINSEKAVIAYPRNVRVPYHVPISNMHISRNKEGRNALPAGMFISKKDGVYRFLPRSRVVAPVSDNRLKVSNPHCFVPGDVLQILNPRTEIGIFSVSEVTLTLNNRTIRYTPVGAANTNEATIMIAKYFNSLPEVTDSLEFIPFGNVLYCYSPIGKPVLTFNFDSVDRSTVPITTPIGTIQAIDPVTEEFILSAPATGVLPIDSIVGISQDEILGIYPHAVDYTSGGITGQNIGVVDEAKLYRLALPHYDNSLFHACPRLQARAVWS